MKKMRVIQSSFLAVMTLLLILTSCTGKDDLPQRIDDFVAKSQLESEEYTNAQWMQSIAQYESLIREYRQKEASFSSEEKQKVANAIGRYHGLLAESALKNSSATVKELIDQVSDITKQVPAYMEGFRDVFDSDSIKLENIFSDIFGSESVKDIIGSIGSLFGGLYGEDTTDIETVVDTLPAAEPADSF